ncbi:cytochrome P450 [Vararia minispora EC-137]|uniref:Cytochrome P450 n=1 Tax=Vararia minispora EC-137 TaxID=1314806 RepID=A0ACB8QMR5_9AGAM|nr:cytochrome P450 [Vararia minispora EC-137]
MSGTPLAVRICYFIDAIYAIGLCFAAIDMELTTKADEDMERYAVMHVAAAYQARRHPFAFGYQQPSTSNTNATTPSAIFADLLAPAPPPTGSSGHPRGFETSKYKEWSHWADGTVPLLRSRTLDVIIVSCVAFGVWLYTSYIDKRRRRGLPYPPGPPGLPLVGNLFDMPSEHEWIVYRDWAWKYGSGVIHLNTLGTHLVVVNTAKAANELFDKRSSLYSDRPSLTSLTEYLSFDWAIGFIPYGPKWRAMRRVFHTYFHPAAAKTYEPLETQAVHRLLRNLLDKPRDFRKHTRHMAGQVILRIAYGIDVLPQNDPFVELAEKALQSVTLATSLGGSIFDLVPILKSMPWWVPGAGFKKEAEKWRPIVQDMVDKPFAATQTAVNQGDAPFSVAASIIVREDRDPMLFPAQIPANFYLGGADTTVSAIQSFFLAMVLYPEVQRKAQTELDSVLCGARLPTFEDQSLLPYVSALAKEVQRWHPVVPLGKNLRTLTRIVLSRHIPAIPHRLLEDDVYEGHFIPAGSIVIGNVWAVLHDPVTFPDPEAFRPEHFLSKSQGGTLGDGGAVRLTEAAFGFGRRECPGRYLARASVWIAVANILAAFEIKPLLDEDGRPIPVEERYTSGIVAYPASFQCDIKLRSNKARDLVLAASES